MKKRMYLLWTLLLSACALLCACGLGACDFLPDEEPHDHELILIEAEESTCVSQGHNEYYACMICEKIFADENAALELKRADVIRPLLDHTLLVWTEEKEPNCTQPGNPAYAQCSSCGQYISRENQVLSAADLVIPALGHTPTPGEGKEATCTQTGLTAGSFCSVCGEELEQQKEVPMKAHTLGEWTEKKDPTCTEDGNPAYAQCSSCKQYFSRENEVLSEEDLVISALGHTPAPGKAKDATCTQTGLTAGSFCSVCGAELERQEEVPMKPHTLGDWTEEKAPTCTEDGNPAYAQCSSCNQYISRENKVLSEEELVIPARGHDKPLKEVPLKEPTWAEDGMLDHWECDSCHTLFLDENGDEKVEADALAIPRETPPTKGVDVDPTTIKGMSSDKVVTMNFMEPADWKAFGGKGNYGGELKLPELMNDKLVFTGASRFEMLWLPKLCNAAKYCHLGDITNGWDMAGTNNNGGDALPYYGQEFLYTLSVSADGAYDLEIFGMSGSRPDRTAQSGWFFNFDGDTVKLYLRAGNNDTQKNVLWAEAKLDGMQFADGNAHNIAFGITRVSIHEYRLSLYVDGYKVLFAAAGEHESAAAYCTVADGAIEVTDSNAHFGQRLSVIPLALAQGGYATVTIASLKILMVDVFAELPTVGAQLSTKDINGKDFFNTNHWELFDGGYLGNYQGGNGKPTEVDGHLEFTAASRFQLLYVNSSAHLGDGNTWKNNGAGASLRGHRFLYTLTTSANGPFDLELFGMGTSSPDLSKDGQCGMFFAFDGSTVKLYFRNGTKNVGGVVLWATAELGASVTDGTQHDLSFSLCRATRYFYEVMVYVDGVKVNFVKDAARTENYFDIGPNRLLFHGSDTISIGQRLSVIPRERAEGEFSTVCIYGLEILHVGATEAVQTALLPSKKH